MTNKHIFILIQTILPPDIVLHTGEAQQRCLQSGQQVGHGSQNSLFCPATWDISKCNATYMKCKCIIVNVVNGKISKKLYVPEQFILLLPPTILWQFFSFHSNWPALSRNDPHVIPGTISGYSSILSQHQLECPFLPTTHYIYTYVYIYIYIYI